jgi:hypothetical protein
LSGDGLGASSVFNVIRLIDESLDAVSEIRRRWSRGQPASMGQVGDGEGNLGRNLPDTVKLGINPTCCEIRFGDFASKSARGSEKYLVSNQPAAVG